MSDKWQKNQLVLAFTEMSRSEAPRDSRKGIDGMTVEQLPAYLKQHWPTIREQLLRRTYKPNRNQ